MSSRRVLRELSEAGTPGPWFVVGPPWNDSEPWINAGSADPHAGSYVCEFDSNSIADIADENLSEDAALIVAARNSLPGLLDRLDTAETALRQIAKPARLASQDRDLSAPALAVEVTARQDIAREALAALEEA